jgi:hypothetical protein
MGINLDRVTVQDCIEMWNRKRFMAILSNGRLLGFQAELKGRLPAASRGPEQRGEVRLLDLSR